MPLPFEAILSHLRNGVFEAVVIAGGSCCMDDIDSVWSIQSPVSLLRRLGAPSLFLRGLDNLLEIAARTPHEHGSPGEVREIGADPDAVTRDTTGTLFVPILASCLLNRLLVRFE